MGWKGTVRSVAAAAKKAEREAERRRKYAAKQEAVADAASAVEDWQDYIGQLVSIHTTTTARMDWHAIANAPCPTPITVGPKEAATQRELDAFERRFFDFLRGGSGARKDRLTRKRDQARTDEAGERVRLAEEHTREVAEWEADRKFAGRVLGGDEAAMIEVLGEMDVIAEDDLIGSDLSFRLHGGVVHAEVLVRPDEEVVPRFRRKQLASGKLSQTKMPAGQRNDLYQDYVASVALKAAGDVFHTLPQDEVYVTCAVDMLDTATGHVGPTPILSVRFVRGTMEGLHLSRVDPSDALTNFEHAMAFKKTSGFARIVPLGAERSIGSTRGD